MKLGESKAITYQKIERDTEHAKRLENGFELFVSEKDFWNGINLVFEANDKDVYLIEFDVNGQIDNSLVEVILPTQREEIRITSLEVGPIMKQCQFAFTPMYSSNSISLRMSTYGKYSVGKIQFKNIRIFDFFPIKNTKDLKEKINFLGPWFHQLNLKGIKTREVNRTDSPSIKNGYTKKFSYDDYLNNPFWIWDKFKEFTKEDLSGYLVLDMGCNSGFYSFEFAKRGANVISFDNSYHNLVQAKFAQKILGINNINFLYGDVKDLKQFRNKFDLILCLGLLYHVQDPKSVIRDVSKLTKIAIFETIAEMTTSESKLICDPSHSADGFLPTDSWLNETFQEAGFTKIERVTGSDSGRQIYFCEK